ncbi:Mediator of RNA polymerase II transcription subunit 13-like [Blomia tropicalis]|nr:Mediator of RNA polymerase II transcription subunit 13-like [Blomia tropicalis]
MTQSSYFLTNGSSLEDCHTNFFALADLCGIKWRQYSTDKHLNDIEDPLLHSYINCLNADLLCVWRRTRNNTQEHSNRINQEICTKELWIFWYGEEPNFGDLISSKLIDYHHMIRHRSLLASGYIRIGPWFLPVKQSGTADLKVKSDKLNDEAQVGFSFKFFLHGDSNVCTNVDLRRLSVLYTISKEDLHAAQQMQGGLRVVLGPFGVEAYLTGVVYKDNDKAIQKLLSEWKKLFPSSLISRYSKENGNLNMSTFNSDENKKGTEADFLDRMVEVIIGDFRAKFPLWFVFITERDRKLRINKSNMKLNGNATETISQINKRSDQVFDSFKLISTPYYVDIPTDTYCLKSNTNQSNNFCDSLLAGTNNGTRDDCSNDTHLNELLQRKSCNCPKCQHINMKKHLKSNNLNCISSYNPFTGKGKDRSSEKEKGKYLKSSTPFHHRSSLNLAQDVEFAITTCSLIQSTQQSTTSPVSSTVNGISNMNQQSNATPVTMSYKSPENTSSRLNTPGIESSPLSNFNLESTEHNTSPNVPKEETVSISTPTNIVSPKDKIGLETVSPNNSANMNLNNNLENVNTNVKVNENITQNGDSIKSETVTIGQLTQTNTTSDISNGKLGNILKRSLLMKNMYEGEHDLRGGLLYDFTSESESWDLPPPKNRRTKDVCNINGYLIDLNKDFSDSYIVDEQLPELKQQQEHTTSYAYIDDELNSLVSKVNGTTVNTEQQQQQQQQEEEVTQENVPQQIPENTMNGNANDLIINKLVNKIRSDHETTSILKSVTNSKYSRNDDDYGTSFDFDFCNSSGDESNDNFQAPFTPKNINGTSTVIHHDGTDNFSSTLNNTSILGPAELSRMFPTPPSLEGMVSSPCNNSTFVATDSTKVESKVECPPEVSDKRETSTTNAIEDDSKDGFYVYRPPMQSLFITSNKYAPLENVDCVKRSLPSNCYYKHNVKKQQQQQQQQQTMKNFNMISAANSSQLNSNLVPNKPKPYMHMNTNKMSFPNSMIRNVRPPNVSMPTMNGNFMNRVRPSLNMQSQMFNFPPDNYNGNFRQNSPSINIDPSLSPMPNNFMSSPVASFDNRKSPYPFGQVSINSPSSTNPFIPNSPMNNSYNSTMPSQKMSPMVGSTFYMNTNVENNANSGPPEINSLMFNLILSDSMFNLFRDHNFESCSICVCNMNIKGSDTGIYLPDSSQQSNYDYYPCTCGFSALTNRHLSQFSGLFYEDEVEITNIFYDPSEKGAETTESNELFDKDLRKALTDLDENFINLIISLSTTTYPSTSTFSKLIHCDNKLPFKTFNLNDNSLRLYERDPLKLLYKDLSEVVLMSLNMTRSDSAANVKPNSLLMNSHNYPLFMSRPVLHDWTFRSSNHPVSNQEVMFMLKTLQPIMQEAVQRKGSSNEVTYNTVKGPLTWRQFHRLAGRGTEYQCEPQPIPSLLAGYDKDCVVVSPFALKYWEYLSLEPYAIVRDIGYIVLVPELDDHHQSAVKNFFKELSTTYELLRFGRHFPLRKLFKDGFCVVGNGVKKNESVQIEEWYNNLGESNLAAKIKQYAQSCYNLIPNLSVYERSLFESPPNKVHSDSSHSNMNMNHNSSGGSSSNNNNNPASMNGNLSNSFMSNSSSSPSLSSSNNSSSFGNSSQRPMNNYPYMSNSSSNNINSNNNNNNNSSDNPMDRGQSEVDNHTSSANDPSICQVSTALQPYEDEDDEHKYPVIVIYIVDPFAAYGKEASRLGCIGLLKSFSNMVKYLPENIRNNVHLQLISIDTILNDDKDFRNISRQDQLKELSFSIYSQCKQQLIFQPNVKSLTGLGPAASFEVFLKEKDADYNKIQLYTTPFILAPLKDKQTELGEMFGDRREKSQILYCCYCLSEDQKWLLVSCTNDKGDIVQSKIININIPNRRLRRNASVRRFGLDKLMNFVQTVMSESVLPWRLVIGRLGRIGHGELKDWTSLLSKKSLLKYSRQLRELCGQCRDLGPHDQPAIYSACLISLEADTSLRVFPNYFTPDERFSSSCNTCSLSTPEDASCTHILVFPTSATTQSSHANFNLMDGMDAIGANLGEEFFTSLEETDLQVGEDDLDFDNFWNDALLADGNGRDGPQPDSPGNRQSFGASNHKNSNLLDDQDEPAQLLQQPLALAFYVSTARTGPLPRWFWANSPHLENTCPVFLKSALLIHTPFVQQNTDDLLHSNNRDCHPLDSSLTTDVLRCALEGYNSLSWLTLNPVSNDRMSCLPLHIQALMQLYHSVQALI